MWDLDYSGPFVNSDKYYIQVKEIEVIQLFQYINLDV